MPTTAGDSIIGSTMIVVQTSLPRNLRLISQASVKPISTWKNSVQNTKCAVACILCQMSSSVRIRV